MVSQNFGQKISRICKMEMNRMTTSKMEVCFSGGSALEGVCALVAS